MNINVRLRSPSPIKLRFQPGATGPSGTVTVNPTTITGAPGTDASVSNSGTPTDAILQFTIPRGNTGLTGDDGWSPILAIVTDGLRRVLQIADWTGGEGTKPATGSYIGPTGLVPDAASAVDIRGPTGATGPAVSDGDKGDITVSSLGTVYTVDNDVVTNAKLANMATATIKGRVTASTGDPEDLTPAQARTVAQIDTWNGGRNLVINGDFRINQRAYAGTAVGAGVYTFDRWKAGASGVTFAASGGNASISAGSLVQVIEGASIAYSGTYVINWVGTSTCTVDGVAKTKGQTFTLTQGTNCTVIFSTGTVGSVQVEFGVIPTAFETRHYGHELMLCQRYYVRFGQTGVITIGSGFSVSTLICISYVALPVPMRAIPVLSMSAASAITADSQGGTGGTTSVVITSTSPAGRTAVDLFITTSGSYAVPTPILVRVAANGWLGLDAEL